MTDNERTVLFQALNSLDNVVVDDHVYTSARLSTLDTPVDLYNYRAIGKMMMGKRMLAELLGCPFGYALPGECFDDDTDPAEVCRFTDQNIGSLSLPLDRKQWLIDTVLVVLNGIGGLNDGDDACLRVAKRRIAEVAGHHNLSAYRLMMEDEVKPLYFKEYIPNE